VLRRVQAGARVTVTVNGRPVAELVPVQVPRRRWIVREELVARLRRAQADPGLRADLARLAARPPTTSAPFGEGAARRTWLRPVVG
jgi:prevent-host-death family protein